MDLPSTLYDLPRTLLGSHTLIVKAARAPRDGGSVEQRLARLEAERDVRAVLNQYAYCYDEGDIDGLMEIYSEDCRLISDKGTFVGTEAIRATYSLNIGQREYGYHHVNDVQVVLDDDATSAWASGFLYNLAVRGGAATGTMANCLFHLAVRDGRWQVIESRIVVSNRHSMPPRDTPPPTVPEWATSSGTVADLIDDLAT
jgi:ketosteroid isomerase-like protein